MPDAVIAFDLATQVGWAAWKRGRGVRHGSRLLPKTGSDVGRFLDAYQAWLRRALHNIQPDAVCFELPFVGGKKSSQATASKLLGLAAVTELTCYQWGLEPQHLHSVHTGTMALHFTGNGGGKSEEKKARIMARCRALGYSPENQDAADAIGLLDYYLHWLKIDNGVRAGPLFRPEPPATILAAG